MSWARERHRVAGVAGHHPAQAQPPLVQSAALAHGARVLVVMLHLLKPSPLSA
jgi:hypothetical protein